MSSVLTWFNMEHPGNLGADMCSRGRGARNISDLCQASSGPDLLKFNAQIAPVSTR